MKISTTDLLADVIIGTPLYIVNRNMQIPKQN